MRRVQKLTGGDSMLMEANSALGRSEILDLATSLWKKALFLSVIVVCSQCSSSAAPAAARETEDLFGTRFRCHRPAGRSICLSLLRPECRLEVRKGEGLPQEPGDRLMRLHGEKPIKVEGPSDMIGCVTISSSRDALEYLRFFSSMKTVDIFRDEMLEIYESPGDFCYLVCLPASRWKTLGFSEPLVDETERGFRVTRFIIKPIPNYNEVSVFRVTQTVSRAGEVKEVSSDLVTVPSEDLLYLGFPRYL